MIEHDEAPEGYHWEWVADENWKVGGGYKCRMLRCPNRAVAAFRRNNRHAIQGWSWWHYCADHLYGRKIEGGVVKVRRLVENKAVTA